MSNNVQGAQPAPKAAPAPARQERQEEGYTPKKSPPQTAQVSEKSSSPKK